MDIESALFLVCFTIEKNKREELDFEKTIYPIYFKHDEIIYTKKQTVFIEGSIGPEKTSCAPFFLAIKIVLKHDDEKFAIISQNNKDEAKSNANEFRNSIGDIVEIVTEPNNFSDLYKKKYMAKPVIAMFTHSDILSLMESNILQKTRICINEVHQRSVLIDVLIARINTLQTNFKTEFKFLLMSAVPDESVMKCFNDIHIIKCDEETLYPIYQEEKELANDNDVIENAAQSIADIIDIMVQRKSINNEKRGEFSLSEYTEKNKTLEKGNILCFLTGNKMINDVISCVQRILSKKNNIYFFQRNFKEDDKNIGALYKKIDEKMKENDDPKITYVLPVKVTSFISQNYKSIAQNPLNDKYRNIIKVICATNVLESSIGIDNLAAVVDSGLCNSQIFDSESGIPSFKIVPITERMHMQRKGRLGRTRPGLLIKFTYKKMKMQCSTEPDILASDLCLTILDLRQIGIKLEKLNGLPDAPQKEDLDKSIAKLESNGFMKDEDVTGKGKKASLFLGIPSSFVSSIISISTKEFKKKIDKSTAMLYDYFIASVAFSSNIISNKDSPKLQENFCKHSDLITIIKTMIDLIKNHGTKNASKIKEYGFNKKEFDSIIYNIQTAFHSILKDNKEKESNEEKLKKIFKTFSSFELEKFINNLIIRVKNIDHDWFNSHTAEFSALVGVSKEPTFIFSNVGGKEQSNISIKARPGACTMEVPKKVLIFNITNDKATEPNLGFMLHSMPPGSNEFRVPYSVQCERKATSDLYKMLLYSYLSVQAKSQNFVLMIPDQKINSKATEHFCITNISDKVIITYIPKNKIAKRDLEDAIKNADKVMPYIGGSILVNKAAFNCAVEISCFNTAQYKTNIHFFDSEHLPKCYGITEKTIKFISDNIEKFENDSDHYRIALTGDPLTYSLDKTKDASNRCSIIPSNNEKSVFSKNQCYPILMIDDSKLQPREKALTWNFSPEKVEKDDGLTYIINNTNSISPELIKISMVQDAYVLSNIVHETGRSSYCYKTMKKEYEEFETIKEEIDSIKEDIESIKKELGKKCNEEIKRNEKLRKEMDEIDSCKDENLLIEKYREFIDLHRNDFPMSEEQFFNEDYIKTYEKIKKDHVYSNEQIKSKWNVIIEERIKPKELMIKSKNKVLKSKEKSFSHQADKFHSIRKDYCGFYSKDFDKYYNFIRYGDNDDVISKNQEPKLKEGIGDTIKEKLQNIISKHDKCFQRNCFVYFITQNIPIKEEKFIAKLSKEAENNGLFYDEKIKIITLNVYHIKDSSIGKDKFVDKIKANISKFGSAVGEVVNYKQCNDKNSIYQGFATVDILYQKFVPVVATRLSDAFKSDIPLFESRVPINVMHPALLKDKSQKEIFSKWKNEHKFNVKIEPDGRIIGQRCDVERFLNCINKDKALISTKDFVKIPSTQDIEKLKKRVKEKNRSTSCDNLWTLDQNNRGIILPKREANALREEWRAETEKERNVFGCVLACDKPKPSSKAVTIFFKDHCESKSICLNCMSEVLTNTLGVIYNKNTKCIHNDALISATEPLPTIFIEEDRKDELPKVPIGQLFTVLINEPETAVPAKALITAAATQTLCTRPDRFTFCPKHPINIIIIGDNKDKDIPCSFDGCDQIYCHKCKSWHCISGCINAKQEQKK